MSPKVSYRGMIHKEISAGSSLMLALALALALTLLLALGDAVPLHPASRPHDKGDT